MKIAVLAIGIVNILSGKTKYDWDIYTNNSGGGVTYLTNQGFLIISSGNVDLPEIFDLINNDSRRLLHSGVSIIDSCGTTKDEVLKMLNHNGYDYYPIKAFQKRKSSKKLKTSYTLK